MLLLNVLWWALFIGSFFASMSLFLSLISKEEGPKERIVLSFLSGFVCILTFLAECMLGLYNLENLKFGC